MRAETYLNQTFILFRIYSLQTIFVAKLSNFLFGIDLDVVRFSQNLRNLILSHTELQFSNTDIWINFEHVAH